jgi:uncharacterized protein YxjI
MFSDRSPFANPSAVNPRLTGTRFQFRRKVLKLVGAAFYVYDPSGAVVLYADQKAFKLKEDIRVYTGEDKTTEVIRIAARSIVDFSATYDIYDSPTNTHLGALRRKGLKSIVRDEWQILDAQDPEILNPQDREIGLIQEDSTVLAVLRRTVDLIAMFVPQKYTMTVGNRPVGQMAHVVNPFSSKIDVDFSEDTAGVLDRRVGLAAGVLMSAIEGKQG